MISDKMIREANRIAWNEVMPYHRKAKDSEWDNSFSDPQYVYQNDIELSELNRLGFIGKDIVHLCCNNGIELLSLKRLGAGRCVGFDISDEAIKDAKKRAKRFMIPVEFYQSDVFEIAEDFDCSFDIVYITIGALVWLPDLEEFFAIANRLLRSNGKLFIYDSHPFSEVLPFNVNSDCIHPEICNDYFVEGYAMYNDGIDYYGGVDYKGEDNFQFVHTLSNIINAILSNGFFLRRFMEYDNDISNGLEWAEKLDLKIPLSYILIAEKMECVEA